MARHQQPTGPLLEAGRPARTNGRGEEGGTLIRPAVHAHTGEVSTDDVAYLLMKAVFIEAVGYGWFILNITAMSWLSMELFAELRS